MASVLMDTEGWICVVTGKAAAGGKVHGHVPKQATDMLDSQLLMQRKAGT
jgi:hypothetical protein